MSTVVEAAKMLREMEQQARESVVAIYRGDGNELRGCQVWFSDGPERAKAVVSFELNGRRHEFEVDGPAVRDGELHGAETFVSAWQQSLARAIERLVFDAFVRAVSGKYGGL